MAKWEELRRRVALAGRVTDALSGAPIAGAVVEISRGPPKFEPRRVLSRLDGSYFFLDLPDDTYTLRASVPRLGSRYGAAAPRDFPTRDAAGHPTLNADLQLPPTQISGTVTAKDSGKPVAGAQVRLRGSLGAVRTDGQGHYMLGGLVASKPAIEVSAPGFKTYSETISLSAGLNTVDVPLTPAPEPRS